MGLIKAGMGAIGGVLGDQWKEFIYCESMKPDVLVAAAPTLAPRIISSATAPLLPLTMANA